MARYGGEEIVVIIPDTDLDIARIVAERIRECVEDEAFGIHQMSRSVKVTVSIGVASRLPGDALASAVLKRADVALYRAKELGRNQVVATAA